MHIRVRYCPFMPKISRLKRIERKAAREAIQTAIVRHGSKVAAAGVLGITRQALDRKLAAK